MIQSIKKIYIFAVMFLVLLNPMLSAGAMKVPETIIRIGIMKEQKNILVMSYKKFEAVDMFTLRSVRFAGGKGYYVTPAGDGIKVDEHSFNSKIRFVSSSEESFIMVNGRKYRDTIIVENRNGHLTVINELGVDGYLFGVLPVEVSPKWPIESLKAQAIVSRTYVMNNLGKYEKSGYDLSSDIFSQVYRGVGVENPATTTAVKETSGRVLTIKGQLARSYFFSSCGGYTADVKNVWGSSIKYMRGVTCPYCKDSPRYRWKKHISPQVIKDKLNASGYSVGDIKNIKFLTRTKSGRIGEMYIIHSDGRLKITGHRLRMAVSPNIIKSTLMAIDRKKEDFHFYGRGWGHAVGMCQWGAKGLAERGKGWKDILKFYFPGTKVKKWAY